MSSSVALFLWLILLLALLRYDPAKVPGNSWALWVPVIWIFIVGSRLPSQWLGGNTGQVVSALEDGNSLDRTILSALVLVSVGILMSRSFNWGGFFAGNIALITFLSFGLLSVLWSDFAFVAFKRWIRDLGNYLVILVAMSDRRPFEACRTVFRRLSYLLIPLSILLIKYFPQLSQAYDLWTGRVMYAGATTSKNMLGVLCLVSGLFFFWDTLTRWRDRKEPLTRRIILVNGLFIAMTVWLLNLSSSATSRLCLGIGCAVIVAAHTKIVKRHPSLLKVVLWGGICAYPLLSFVLGIDLTSAVAQAVGRDPTLTDRTFIWQIVLSLQTNPLVGTGYESFWLGSRLLTVWESGFGGINEAHNGYLQMYLNLGLVGVFLLCCFLFAGYRTISSRLTVSGGLASLSLGLWVVLLFYNFTEAAFQNGLLWLMVLPGVMALSTSNEETAEDYRRPSQKWNVRGTASSFAALEDRTCRSPHSPRASHARSLVWKVRRPSEALGVDEDCR